MTKVIQSQFISQVNCFRVFKRIISPVKRGKTKPTREILTLENKYITKHRRTVT